ILETNTFGANRIKLGEYGLADKVKEINEAAVRLARRAIGEKGFVCGSIGPTGQLLEPMGGLSFDQAYETFAEQAKALADAGADLLCFETISDLQEMRAGVLAAKNETSLPVIASMTYDEGEVTVSGTTPEAAAVVLEAIGADILSANCSAGPEGLLKVAERLLAVTNLPVMIMPNAGMPVLESGKAVYKMSPEEFAKHLAKAFNLGIGIVGGCCGTNPKHIEAVREALTPNPSPRGRGAMPNVGVRFSSRTKMIEPDGFIAVGEKINPTGRKIFREELKSGKFKIVRAEAENQTKHGAALLDVNVSVARIDDVAAMKQAVIVASTASPRPLSIDSPNPVAIEAGLKTFCGRGLINSVNGKEESLKTVIPLAKKYGAALIGLVLDEQGIPETVEQKMAIAEKIIKATDAAGIPRDQIYIDNLAMTVGVGIKGALDTLAAIPIVKRNFGVRTILGVSNVSHGMPNRSKLNNLYLKLCLLNGLDAGIVDISDPGIKEAIEFARKIEAKAGDGEGQKAKEKAKERLLEEFKQAVEEKGEMGQGIRDTGESAVKQYPETLGGIEAAVIEGDDEIVVDLTNKLLAKGEAPQKIIDQALVRGMEKVGKDFSAKKIFLPQVMASAEAMKAGFALCKERIPKEEARKVGKVLLATVKGDVHDIGKNIVKMMLENHGFEVIDLGKDVPSETILETAKREKPNAICLSALLTTTMVEMEQVGKELKKEGLNIPIMVGGAVVTDDYAEEIGAFYSSDAVGAVELAKKLIKKIS
ncbi:MAG: homocysteine S-methyltransferase family protein, partial [Candidatus Margulisbacteria bacterium]|nr:homocysteine S-methyltransferase family protein [Candidatus Margulisiibacteriota bacterium]